MMCSWLDIAGRQHPPDGAVLPDRDGAGDQHDDAHDEYPDEELNLHGGAADAEEDEGDQRYAGYAVGLAGHITRFLRGQQYIDRSQLRWLPWTAERNFRASYSVLISR